MLIPPCCCTAWRLYALRISRIVDARSKTMIYYACVDYPPNALQPPSPTRTLVQCNKYVWETHAALKSFNLSSAKLF